MCIRDRVESIVGQMLSNKAAGTLCGRLKNIVGEFPPPDALAAHSAEGIKSCGISRRKAECILALAQDTLEGKYDFSSLETLSDEKVIEFLTQIKGVGRWTAEMIAEFSLGRKNVFSETDVALRNGIMQAQDVYKRQEVSGRNAALTAERMKSLSERGSYEISGAELGLLEEDFFAAYAGEDETVEAMYEIFEEYGLSLIHI